MLLKDWELCQARLEQVRQTAANGWGGLTFESPKKWATGNAAPHPLSRAEGLLDKLNQKGEKQAQDLQ